MEKEWAIVFLIYADFREGKGFLLDQKLVRELNHLFFDIATTNLDSKAEILVIIDRVRYKSINGQPFLNDKTFIFDVEKRDGKKNKLKEIHIDDELLMPKVAQNGEKLKKIFKWIKENRPAKHTLLATWDHGLPFGIFKIEPDHEKGRITEFKSLDSFKNQFTGIGDFAEEIFNKHDFIKQSVEKEFFKNEVFEKTQFRIDGVPFIFEKDLSVDFREKLEELKSSKELGDRIGLNNENGFKSLGIKKSSFPNGSNDLGPANENLAEHLLEFNEPVRASIYEILTNQELSDAIAASFGRIEFMLMMNCYLMNIHTAYTFNKSVERLVAPQGGIDEPGYNYSVILGTIMEKLANAEEVHISMLSDVCVNSTFEAGANSSREVSKNKIEEWAVFAVSPAEAEKIASSINQVAKELADAIIEDKNILPIFPVIWEDCYRFDGLSDNYFLIDLLHWLRKITFKNEIVTPGIQKLFEKITEQKLAFVKAQRIGGSVYDSKRQPKADRSQQPSSLAIYLPKKIDNSHPEFTSFIDIEAQEQDLFLKEQKNWLELLKKF